MLDNVSKSIIKKTGLESTTIGLEPTIGYNIETIASDFCNFYVWDFGGSARVREFWPFYTKQVNPKVIVFVLNGNECIMRLKEAQRVLHWVLDDPYVDGAELMIVVNTRPKPKQEKTIKEKEEGGGKKKKEKNDVGDEKIWVDYDLTKE